jgi:hypothetical protein
MGKVNVFVCYRRSDAEFQTGWICEHLTRAGQFEVFQDVDSMLPGVDFRRVLTEQVAGCDVLLAVIGDTCLSMSGPDGSRRLDDPADFVRIEIEAALARKPEIMIIPVLVGSAPVPKATELPESMRELAFRNCVWVRPNPYFREDLERLVRGIKEAVSAVRARPSAPLGIDCRGRFGWSHPVRGDRLRGHQAVRPGAKGGLGVLELV